MVTFRFYVVSTVAFFLALAVGVVVGSVLDGRIADSLQNRLDRVETSLDETVASIDEKNDEIDRLEQYAEASAPFAVQGELTDTSTVVVAESGLAGASVDDLVRRLRESGSRVEGIVWLEPRWALEDPEAVTRLAELLGEEQGSREGLRSAAWQRVLDAAAPTEQAPSETSPTTTSTPGSEPDLPGATTTTTTFAPTTTETTAVVSPVLFEDATVRALADEGFVRLQSVEGATGVAGGGLLMVAATGMNSTLPTPGDAAIELVRRSSAAGVPTVLAEIQGPPVEGESDQRGVLIARALESDPVEFSTVDDLDLLAGRVAAVLALAQVREGSIGRFGYGPDVDGVLPRWQGP